MRLGASLHWTNVEQGKGKKRETIRTHDMGTLDERAAKETASAKAWRPVPFSQRAAVCAVGTTRYVVDYVADGAELFFATE